MIVSPFTLQCRHHCYTEFFVIARKSREDWFAFGYNYGYTARMKTAVSLPDNIFGAAERHAKRIGISRSRLYAIALAEYLKSQQRSGVKEALDRVYRSHPSEVDPALDAMQHASVVQEDW
jgi:hypothetical protein